MRPPAMSERKGFFIHTLGCKVNQYDSQALSEAWTGRGRLAADSSENALAVVVNSCAVTARAVADARRLLRRLRRENPQARLILTGCAARATPEKFADIEGLHILPPEAALADGLPPVERNAPAAYPACGVSDYGRARAVLKIQDGCSHRCSYCIVPDARGPSRSRPPQAILTEAERLMDAGFHELIISGINLSQYASDTGEDLWDMVAALDALVAARPHRARLRLSSLDPGKLGTKALETLAASRTLCPHLHLSLQSGAPQVLKNMGRAHCRPDKTLNFVRTVAEFWPIFGLGADILTGFPGESREAFEETLAFCRELPLSYGHVFPYSRRPGTPAETFPDQLPRDLKKERAAALRELVSGKEARFVAGLASLASVDVVLEEASPAVGVCEYYAHCRYQTPPAGAPEAKRAIRAAAPVRAEGNVLIIRPLENHAEATP